MADQPSRVTQIREQIKAQDEADDPIVWTVSSGYDNDPHAYSRTQSGKTIWTFPEARARAEKL